MDIIISKQIRAENVPNWTTVGKGWAQGAQDPGTLTQEDDMNLDRPDRPLADRVLGDMDEKDPLARTQENRSDYQLNS